MLKWFSELKVVHKLMLMSVAFLLPDSLMLFMMITDIRDNIEFARLEVSGTKYLRPLVHLLALLPEIDPLHGPANGTGDTGNASQASHIRSQIDQAMQDLQAQDDRAGQQLQFTDAALALRGRSEDRMQTLLSDWKQINTLSPTGEGQVRSQLCEHMLKVTRVMITHAGDMSNLILDPDLNTYYLMDATLLSLPKSLDQVAQAMQDGRAALSNPQADAIHPLARLHGQILRDGSLEHVSNSVQTSLKEDANVHGSDTDFQRQVPPALADYLSCITNFIQLTEHLGENSNNPQQDAATYDAAGIAARTAAMRLWEVSAINLNGMIEQRIAAYERHRNTCLCITAMAMLAASLMVTGINRSINRPLKQQANALLHANAALSTEMKQRKEAQAQLLEASRKAGMAEIAVGVIHNVGNVLNSVNTCATVIRERLDESKVPTLGKAADLIQQHREDQTYLTQDPKGKKIPELLSRLVDAMTEDQKMIGNELDQLSRNVDHIKHIVQAQQSLAKNKPQLEELDLAQTVDDAIGMSGLTHGRHGIDVIRDYKPCGRATTDRHKLLQMLVNLITNAKKAVGETDSTIKRVTLSLEAVSVGDDQVARISVGDTGVGIAPENVQKIFQHGFTTRADGHGFGLHSAANDIHQMGGSIRVTSAGKGHGATFILEIPMNSKQLTEAV